MRALPRVVIASLLLAAACGGNHDSPLDHTSTGSDSAGSAAAPTPYAQPIALADDFRGLAFQLSNGKVGKPAVDRATLAPAKPLSQADTDALLARVAAPPADPAAAQPFALRPATEPPPKPGTTVTEKFPPPPSALAPPPPPAADLTVVRYGPEGKLPSANQLSITFSQPMVAVTSQDQAAATIPAKLSPEPKGQWRWLGTRTLVFEPADGMFPRATTYAVDVAAGAKSALGVALAKPVHFTFETPAPRLIQEWPGNGPRRPDEPIIAVFDQKIDAAAVAAKLTCATVPASPGDPHAPAAVRGAKLRLATGAELADHDRDRTRARFIDGLHAQGLDGHWVAVVPAAQALPLGSRITVTIPPGTPSAEGPNGTADGQDFGFETYGPFSVQRWDCNEVSTTDPRCRPEGQITLVFSNPIDRKTVAKPGAIAVTTEPPVPNLHVEVGGTAMSLTGEFPAMTKITVKLAASLGDIYDQQLAAPVTHEIEFAHAESRFTGATPGSLVIADPADPAPHLTVFTRNYPKLAVKLYRVRAADYAAYRRFVYPDDNDHRGAPPGDKVFDQTIDATAYADDKLVETHVDLAPALAGAKRGHVYAVIEPRPWDKAAHVGDEIPPRLVTWVEVTGLAVDAYADPTSLVAFASDLATGAPIAGATVTVTGPGATGSATTAATGLATLPIPHAGIRYDAVHVLTVAKGDDTAFMPDDRWGTWNGQPRGKQLAWFVTDDRRTYRPGETVSLKGYLRAVEHTLGGDTVSAGARVHEVTWIARDYDYKELAHGTATVDAHGGFDLSLKLPKTPLLGRATIALVAPGWRVDGDGIDTGGGYTHQFQIQEFRRPEFEVSAHAGEGPFILGEGGDFTATAKYYAGGPLAAAATSWRVTASAASYAPPGHEEFAFGAWRPAWGGPRRNRGGGIIGNYGGANVQTWRGTTDGAGAHVLHVDFRAMKPREPMTVTATATIQDVNRQGWTTSASAIVHPAARYVGVRAVKPFVAQGTAYAVDVIGTTIAGDPAVGAPIEVKTVRLVDKEDPATGEVTIEEVDPQTCSAVAAKAPVPCQFATREAGRYKLVATITDDAGRTNATELAYWVAGEDVATPAVRAHVLAKVGVESIELVPDKASYAPGATAEILVRSPIVPGEAVVRYEREGIVKIERVAIAHAQQVITVPLSDAEVPNLVVEVDVFGAAVRTDANGDPDPAAPKRPAHATGSIDLPISLRERTLAVTAKPAADKLAPGEATTVAVAVADGAGKPVANAGVAVIVVDEAILALASATFGDPLDVFYPAREGAVAATRMRELVALLHPDAKPGKPARMLAPGQGGSIDTGFDTGFDDYGGDLGVGLGNEAPGDMNGGFGYGRSGFGPGGGGSGWGTIGTGRYGTIGHGAGTGNGYGVGGGRGGMAPPTTPDAVTKPAAMVATRERRKGDIGGGGGGYVDADAGAAAASIALRANFDPLAAFVPAATTGADGTATVDVRIPDNLTRYRVIAFAVEGDRRFGKGESAITARLPMMVRPSAPRFLNFGDTFELPIVVQNQTAAPLVVRLALRTDNLTLTAGAGREVTVPADDRVEVRFPAAAASAGTAKFQVVSTTVGLQPKDVGDAAEVSLPVWTPVTTEAFATYGTVDDPETAMAQPIALPGGVVPQYGGLEVSTASTNLQALTDAVLYIVHYPFECAEQRASRMLTIAALRDVLGAFHAPGLPGRGALEASMTVDLEKLRQMQGRDGGFGFWDTKEEWPYLTVFVTQAMAIAKAKGYAVPADMLGRAQQYLRNIGAHMTDPDRYPPEEHRRIEAYALAVRRQLADPDIARATALLAEAGDVATLDLDTAGWLLQAVAGDAGAADARAKLVRLAHNRATETAGAAHLATAAGDYGWVSLWSAERADAVMLDGLIAEEPASDLIPKLVTGILGSKRKGRWESTQENAFVLLALEHYFRVYEKVTPAFVARVWLGGDFAGEHAFTGHTTETDRIDIPMTAVAAHDHTNLTIAKAGKGRLYYRVGMSYAPSDFAVAAADRGFVVTRTYEPVDDQGDVTRDVKTGAWHVKAGARVRVRLHMVNESPRHHVALVDPLPAGLEALNPALATTGALPGDPDAQSEADAAVRARGERGGGRGYAGGRSNWWRATWYDHDMLRDERVEAFTAFLPDGVHAYTYIARATTPGTFVVPPTKAEEMYAPETFGRAASDRVVVDP